MNQPVTETQDVAAAAECELTPESADSFSSAHSEHRDSMGENLTDPPGQLPSDSECDRTVMEAVRCNGQLLQQILEQLALMRGVGGLDEMPGELAQALIDESDSEQRDRLHIRIAELEDQVYELEQQNSDLASRVASSNLQQTVSTPQSSCTDALSWEDRKQVILEQMESDTFDSEAFISSLQQETSGDECDDPSEFVASLSAELELREQELARREEEIHELRCLLDQQSETREGGVAIGAAAIAEMIDSDELIQQERERLQLLQAEWEEKFRQSEIEASLERAKLSRERKRVAEKEAELEEQIEHLRREARHTPESGKSRKWLVALGLSDDSDAK